jgi:hypothetical protein
MRESSLSISIMLLVCMIITVYVYSIKLFAKVVNGWDEYF